MPALRVDGFLASFTELTRRIDVERIAWPEPVVDPIGVANQFLPVLVLADDVPPGPRDRRMRWVSWRGGTLPEGAQPSSPIPFRKSLPFGKRWFRHGYQTQIHHGGQAGSATRVQRLGGVLDVPNSLEVKLLHDISFKAGFLVETRMIKFADY
jgi:hypothetical protein